MFNLDDWYQKHIWPHIYLWDQTYDQSHLHHLVFNSLVFGPIGVIMCGFFQGWQYDLIWTSGYAAGLIGGFIGYTLREIRVRIAMFLDHEEEWPDHSPKYNWWDGSLDVLFQMIMTVGLVHEATRAELMPSTVWLYILGIVVITLMYTVKRPPDMLHYNTGYNMPNPR